MKKILIPALLSVALFPHTATADLYYKNCKTQEYSSEGEYLLSRASIRKVQRELKEYGYYEGALDGIWGPKTEIAIKSFQLRNHLSATGALDPETLDVLGVQVKDRSFVPQNSCQQ